MKAEQENTIQESPADEKLETDAPYGKSKGSQDQSARLVQILQKQSTQLDRISKALEKHQQMTQQLKSSVNDMEKRMRAAEKRDSAVFEWVNRKIAKKNKKKKNKKR